MSFTSSARRTRSVQSFDSVPLYFLRSQNIMLFTTFVSLLLVILCLVHVSAHPLQSFRSSSAIGKQKHKIKSRQFEEEIAQGAEDSIELFEFPRVHDSSEQIHERTEQQNITTKNIILAINKNSRKHGGLHRLPAQVQGEGEFTYDRQRNAVGSYRYGDSHGNSREAEYSVADHQSASGEYKFGPTT